MWSIPESNTGRRRQCRSRWVQYLGYLGTQLVLIGFDSNTFLNFTELFWYYVMIFSQKVQTPSFGPLGWFNCTRQEDQSSTDKYLNPKTITYLNHDRKKAWSQIPGPWSLFNRSLFKIMPVRFTNGTCIQVNSEKMQNCNCMPMFVGCNRAVYLNTWGIRELTKIIIESLKGRLVIQLG